MIADEYPYSIEGHNPDTDGACLNLVGASRDSGALLKQLYLRRIPGISNAAEVRIDQSPFNVVRAQLLLREICTLRAGMWWWAPRGFKGVLGVIALISLEKRRKKKGA